jgi:hypothetical protein
MIAMSNAEQDFRDWTAAKSWRDLAARFATREYRTRCVPVAVPMGHGVITVPLVIRCTVRVPRDQPPKPPPASTGLSIKLGDVWRRALDKKQKKEPKKP